MAKRIIGTTPKEDGFRMPGEFEAQDQIFMIWPERPDNWRDGAKPVQIAFTNVAEAISRFTPVTMLVSTAIIQNLSQDQIEAAKIDGANTFQVFKSITFPQILFVLTPTLIQQFIGNFNNFNVIYLLTGGGPNTDNNLANAQAGTTDLLITWLYKLTTQSTRNYALASAIGIIIFVITATASLALYRRTNAFKEG